MASKDGQDSDERFLRVKKDPRFWEMPEKERKIKIDKRFQSMFHDERFKLKYTVDKRGRPFNHSSTEDLKRFYKLSDSEESEEEPEEKKTTTKKKKKNQKSKDNAEPEEKTENLCLEKKTKPKKGKKSVQLQEIREASVQPRVVCKVKGLEGYRQGEEESSCDESDEEALEFNRQYVSEGESDDEEDDEETGEEEEDEDKEESVTSAEEESEEDSDSGPDLARGKGNIETSSDEDEDDEVEELLRLEEEKIQHDWGEMWKDAPRSDTVTHRFAVCNIDWDRLKAKDLLALFNSFKPKDGVVLSVKVYPSEFGKERMKVEQAQGPLQLMTLQEDPEKDTEEERIYREQMRDYQFKRMRYYYAVVECDSPATAGKIYDECDGFEYESSSSVLDLRFVPDDLTFDDSPKDVATDVDLAAYTPKYFTSTATSTSKVEVTWDETDHDRVTSLNKTFKKDEILAMDFQAYLASSSEDDDEGQGEKDLEGDVKVEVEKNPRKSHKDDAQQIAKYQEMLKSIQEKDNKLEDKAMEMEVTWIPGLKETTEQLVKKKLEGKTRLTPWEEFLQKKKEKKKLKKGKHKQTADESDQSEDDLPPDVDLSDPYFAEELGTSGPGLKTKSKKGKKSEEEEKTPEEEAELERQRAEMMLLMDDEDEDEAKRQHFNYDKIVEQQNLSKKKRKKLLRKNKLLDDDFKVDVNDPRFQAMFTSHLYNLDPSDPSYKKTKATQSILEEKQRRREERQRLQEEAVKRKQQELEQEVDAGEKLARAKKTMDPALSMLIKSIKNKTEQFQARKKQKTK